MTSIFILIVLMATAVMFLVKKVNNKNSKRINRKAMQQRARFALRNQKFYDADRFRD